jgi:hypothetical protein
VAAEVAAITAVAVAAASMAEAAATVVVDTGNYGLTRTIEVPLICEKARLLRQAGFFVCVTSSLADKQVPDLELQENQVAGSSQRF